MKHFCVFTVGVIALALVVAGCEKKVATAPADQTPAPVTAAAEQAQPTSKTEPNTATAKTTGQAQPDKTAAKPTAGKATGHAQATPNHGQKPTATAQHKSTKIPGLVIEDITVGKGATAVAGKTVTVHYTGWLTDGTKFDSSVDSNQPFTFQLGAGRVIQGWDKGVVGMKVGGKRKLTISPKLGYGADGAPPVIPPNATLIFDVELLGVQ